MKNNNKLTVVSLVCICTSVAFIFFHYHLIAAIFGLLTYFTSLFTLKSVTRKWQIYLSFFIAPVAGYTMGIGTGGVLLALCLLSLVMMPGIRTLLFEQVSSRTVGWLESALGLSAIGFYFVGNLYGENGWIGWAFAATPVLFGTFMAVGFRIDRNAIWAGKGAFGVGIGKPAPPFTLSDEENKPVSLSDYKNKRHVLLIFVRGDWCPTCHIMLRTYEKFKDKFAEKNIMLLAIGPDSVGINREMVKRLGLDYKLLCDDKGHAAKSYGILFQPNNFETKFDAGIPLPASFLVSGDGTLLYTSDPFKPGAILRPDTIFPVIEKLGAIN